MDRLTKLTWRVEGMDCAACVAMVTTAVECLHGVTEVEVNLRAERLSATLAPGGAAPAAVARHVATLGYTATPLSEGHVGDDHAAHHHHEDPADSEKPWCPSAGAPSPWRALAAPSRSRR